MNRHALSSDPFEQFAHWLDAARSRHIEQHNGMALATTDSEGRPSMRIVLLRGVDANGFVFYTNYESRKARELECNPKAALLFWWRELHRQIRIEGSVRRVSREASEQYFAGRPRGHKLGAWASDQSAVIANRQILETRLEAVKVQFPDEQVPCPPHWGGYRLTPDGFEFWEEGPDRLHDRLRYSRCGGHWSIDRLSP